MSSWVYVKSTDEHNLWTVGFFAPDGKWHPETDWTTSAKAAKRVHWLNGGSTPWKEVLDG